MVRRNYNFVVFILSIVTILLVGFSIYLLSIKPLESHEFIVTFIVGGNAGFDLNSSALTFGKIQKGMSSTRSLIVENSYDFPVQVKFLASKNIAEFIFAENVVIEAKENVSIPVILTVSENLDLGNYSGNLKVELYESED